MTLIQANLRIDAVAKPQPALVIVVTLRVGKSGPVVLTITRKIGLKKARKLLAGGVPTSAPAAFLLKKGAQHG